MEWLLLALCLLPTTARAEWTTTDTVMEATYAAVHVMDWRQTRVIAKSEGHWRETNGILGDHPSRDKVDTWFAGTLAGHAIISYLLPDKWRTTWQAITIGMEATTVVRNYQLGIKVAF